MKFPDKMLMRLGLYAVGIATLLTSGALAGDYYSSVPFLPTVKIGPTGTMATPVEKVYGKEYSHTDWNEAYFTLGLDPNLVNIEDHDAFAAPDPLQVVSFDGKAGPSGGNSGSTDGFDYSTGVTTVDGQFPYPEGQVDALANHADFLFHQVLGTEAAPSGVATLLFSTTADLDASSVLTTGPIVAKAHVHYEPPVGGPGGIWAAIEAAPAGPGPGPGVNHHVVEDLDALEVWGPEPPSHNSPDDDPVVEGYIPSATMPPGPNTADADRFSLDMDSASGTSVWAYDIPTKSVSPYIPHGVIVDAVEDLFLGVGVDLAPETRDQIDVDGTMVRDTGTVGTWDTGDELLFTIDPLMDSATGLIIDGGEIMHLKFPGGPGDISFLWHGGHKWDTAFKVADTFGYEFEDVDALEAVGTVDGGTDINTPEPSALALLLLGLATLGVRRVWA